MKKGSIISVEGKRIVLTGACGLLGTQMAHTLAEEGATLLLLDTVPKREALERFANIGIAMDDHEYLECDITDPDALKKVASEIRSRYGGVDVLINNAAFNPKVEEKDAHQHTFDTYPLNEWEKELRVNLTGTMLVCQAMHPFIQKGSIINIASIYALVGSDQRIYPKGFEKPASYGASKAGVIALTKHLATLWASSGTRVNAVVYGGFENGQDAAFVREYSTKTPLGRLAKPEEAPGIVLFLASEASSYATGAVFTIDGGWTAW